MQSVIREFSIYMCITYMEKKDTWLFIIYRITLQANKNYIKYLYIILI
jgi:hypothetical protein